MFVRFWLDQTFKYNFVFLLRIQLTVKSCVITFLMSLDCIRSFEQTFFANCFVTNNTNILAAEKALNFEQKTDGYTFP